MPVGRPRVGPVEPARRGRPGSGRRAPTARRRRRRAASRPRSASQSAIASNGSKAPVLTSPACAHTSTGPVEVGQQVGPHPALVVGGHDGAPGRGPGRRGRATSTASSAPARRRRRSSGGAPNSPSAWTSQPEAGEQRVAGGGEAGGVGHGRAGDERHAGPRRQAEQVDQPAAGDVVRAWRRPGDMTGSAAFWSHAPASHDAAERRRVRGAGDEAEVARAGRGHGRRAADLVEQAQRLAGVGAVLGQRLVERGQRRDGRLVGEDPPVVDGADIGECRCRRGIEDLGLPM